MLTFIEENGTIINRTLHINGGYVKDTRQKGLNPDEPIEAVIGSVRETKGYATAYPIPGQRIPHNKDITFSLDKWSGKGLPLKAQVVRLDDVTMFVGGWRASSASPVTPSSDGGESNGQD